MKRHEISDEQLAAYMENLFCGGRLKSRAGTVKTDRRLLEDVDSIEVLGVSRRALEMFRLPDWKAEDADFRADEMRRYAMTGFLGDEDDDDSADGIDAGDIAAGEDNGGVPDIR